MLHMPSNIPSPVFCGSIFLKPLHRVRLTQRINDVIPRAFDFFQDE